MRGQVSGRSMGDHGPANRCTGGSGTAPTRGLEVVAVRRELDRPPGRVRTPHRLPGAAMDGAAARDAHLDDQDPCPLPRGPKHSISSANLTKRNRTRTPDLPLTTERLADAVPVGTPPGRHHQNQHRATDRGAV